jgi:excisionase family DNA binding protein
MQDNHRRQEISGGLAMDEVISFSVRAAAGQSSLCERTLRSAIKNGELRALRVGRRLLITPASLREYLHGRTKQHEAGAK